MQQSPHIRRGVLTAFVASALVTCGLLAGTWKLVWDADQAADWIKHTYEVLNTLTEIRSGSLQIELSNQNFRITQDKQNLRTRDAMAAIREKNLQRVRTLTQDNTAQQARWQKLQKLIDAQTPIYATLDEMAHEELGLLKQRRRIQSDDRRITLFAGVFSTLGLLLMLILGYRLIRRQLADTATSQKALARSEESLATTLHSIGDAVLTTDLEGRVTRMNSVAERLTGWTQEEALDQPVTTVFRIIHEHTRMPAEIPVGQALATGQVQTLADHTVLVARDGQEWPIADSAAPIRDASGNLHGVVLVFRDVSIERKAQQVLKSQNEWLEQRVQERTARLQEAEAHLKSVTSNAPAMIAFVDAQQRYVYANQLYLDCFAPGKTDITQHTVREILGKDTYEQAEPMIVKALRGEMQTYDIQPFPQIWHTVNYVPRCDSEGQVIGYYVLSCDITDRKRDEQKISGLNAQLTQQVRRLGQVSRALRTLSSCNRTLLRATNKIDLLESMCRAVVENGGYRMASVWYRVEDEAKTLRPMAQYGYAGGMANLHALKPDWGDGPTGQGIVARAIRSGQSVTIRNIQTDPNYTVWRTLLPGAVSGLALPLYVQGSVIGALAIYAAESDAFGPDEMALLSEASDDLAYGISTWRERIEQEKTREAMNWLSQHDALTKLPNEAHFTERLAQAISVGIQKQTENQFAVLQVNIERLSEINDALGFAQGDQMLCEFGSRLGTLVADSPAFLARLRGDEFAILLPGADEVQALSMAHQIKSRLSQPFPLADIELDLSARVGIALFPQHGKTVHDLYRHIDLATRQAKKARLDHAVFDLEQSQDPSRRLVLAGELKRAIEGNDLRLFLQPKVEMASGSICGAEALVRWQHAERGLIPPGEFISLAEHTGLIQPLTDWVLRNSLHQNLAWLRQQQQAIPIAVNLSARNLHDPNLPDKIRQLLIDYELPPHLLELEITESTVMEDAERALHVLQALRTEGLALYIDDFGTGYSSLSYLQKLPVDYIKIDQSFIRRMSTDQDSLRIVRSTIDLVHDLGRKAVAEGVETQKDWDLLRHMGCDYVQGYFIARPMLAKNLPAWLTDSHQPNELAGAK